MPTSFSLSDSESMPRAAILRSTVERARPAARMNCSRGRPMAALSSCTARAGTPCLTMRARSMAESWNTWACAGRCRA